jgi:S1-C subfamily serine protease
VTPRGNLAEDERSTIELFEAASPAVVHIATSRIAVRESFTRREFFEIPEGSGSGFVWDQDGHIVTNYHVLRDADSADVRFPDGSVYKARLVGAAPDFDLAVLEIDAPPGIRPLPVGASADLQVGQKVFAIGNPFGLDQTLTTGIISGLERSIRSQSNLLIHGVIQTDAAINPGNSGGPLLDSSGRLIGVNTAIASPSGAYAGVGFAVPVDSVNRVVPRILREGRVERAGLGIVVGPDPWATGEGIEGAVVESVQRGSPADRSGIVGTSERRDGSIDLGDVIVGIDGKAIRGSRDLFRVLEDYREGDVVHVRLSRPGAEGRSIAEVDVELARLQ